MGNLPPQWTQQSSNALKALAGIALDYARRDPEEWENPTPLNSKVRYLPDMIHPVDGIRGVYEIYGVPVGTRYMTLYRTRNEAQQLLFECWANELRSDDTVRNVKFVDELILNNEIGLWK